MPLNRLYLVFPGWRAVLTVLLSTLAGAALALAVSAWFRIPNKPAPNPGPPHDPRFITLGKAFLPQLGKAYAAAWEEGAKQLEAGQSVTAALDTVSKTWSSNRTQLYDHVITPKFSRIVAESIKDTDVTSAERAALAAAWRGLSLGLGNH
jgi:hypothetical protein